MLTKDEFLNRLKTNEILPDYNDTINQKFPVLKYFLEHYMPSFNINGQIFNFKNITLYEIKNKDEWILMNQAFKTLVERYNNKEFN